MQNDLNEKSEIVKKKKTSIAVYIAIGTVLIVGIAVGIYFFVQGNDSKVLKNYLECGERYLLEIDYENAIASFEKAIEIDPKSVDAYLGLADAYIAMAESSVDDADKYYKKALEILVEGYAKTNDESIASKINDVNGYLESINNNSSDSDLSLAQVGDIVNFGLYDHPYDSDETIPLEWEVVATEDGRVLLLSRYILCDYVYDQAGKDWDTIHDTNWKESDIREYLNNTLIYELFDEKEINRIQTVTITNPSTASFHKEYCPSWDFEDNTNVCGDTEDRLFLLGWEDIVKYYGLSKGDPNGWGSECLYNEKLQADFRGHNEGYWWWLRSQGYLGCTAMNIYIGGTVDFSYGYGVHDSVGVRPAMYVEY